MAFTPAQVQALAGSIISAGATDTQITDSLFNAGVTLAEAQAAYPQFTARLATAWPQVEPLNFAPTASLTQYAAWAGPLLGQTAAQYVQQFSQVAAAPMQYGSNVLNNTADWQAAVAAWNSGRPIPAPYFGALQQINAYYQQGQAAPGNMDPILGAQYITQKMHDAAASGSFLAQIANHPVAAVVIAAAIATGTYLALTTGVDAGVAAADAAASGTAGTATLDATTAAAASAAASTADAASKVSSATTTATDLTNAASSSVISTITDTLGTLGNTVQTAITGIGDLVQTAQSTLSAILSPIKDTLDAVTGLANQIQSGLIEPIVGPITAAVQSYHDLLNSLNGDLGQGLAGIVKIPGQIADALTSTDAAFNRAVQQLGINNADLAAKVIVPALSSTGSVPIDALHDTIKSVAALYTGELAAQPQVAIAAVSDGASLEAQQRDLIQTIQNGTTWYDKVAQVAIQLFAIPAFIEMQNAPMLDDLSQLTWQAHPGKVLDVGTAVAALFRGILSQAEVTDEVSRQGFSAARLQVITELAKYLPTPSDAILWNARSLITDAELQQIFLLNRWDGIQTAMALDTAYAPIGAREYMAARGRDQAGAAGFMAQSFTANPPADVKAQYKPNLRQVGAATSEWLLHWNLPGPDWWTQAVFRGIRTRDEYYQAMKANNIPDELHDDIIAVNQELLHAFMVPDIIASGAMTKEDGLAYAARRGMAPQDALLLVNYGLSKSKASKATTAGDLQKLSLSNAATLYDDGAITHDQYASILVAHGYGPESTALTITLADIKQATASRKAYADGLVAEAKAGLLTQDQVISDLYAQGFSDAEVAVYQDKIHTAKVAAAKLPSRAELDKLVKAGIISKDDWTATMIQLGYSAAWTEALYAIV